MSKVDDSCRGYLAAAYSRILQFSTMHGKIKGQVCVYTDRSGLYQSLINLSVMHYVSIHYSKSELETPSFLCLQDLSELLIMCSTQQWSERRDGIAQLHLLLESSRPFT